MRNIGILILLCSLIVGTAIITFSSNAKADETHRKTIVSFSRPVELPGVALPAGTYVFKLVDPYSNSSMVQVFSEDEKTLYASIRAIPNYRLERTADTVIALEEREAGVPPAVKELFYPGQHYGYEFIYPKQKPVSMVFAQRSRQVALIPAEIGREVLVHAESAEADGINSSSGESQLADVHAPQQPTRTEQMRLSNTEQEQVDSGAAMLHPGAGMLLPRTASPLPLIGLVGILLLGGVIALRLYSNTALKIAETRTVGKESSKKQ